MNFSQLATSLFFPGIHLVKVHEYFIFWCCPA